MHCIAMLCNPVWEMFDAYCNVSRMTLIEDQRRNHRLNIKSGKDPKAMTSLKLLSYSKPPG